MTRKEGVTSLDVAELAGVSQSAVSRVFTPGASVSKRMREQVERAAEQLGYRPNVLARSLIKGRSRIVGLVVAYLENQFYPVALEKLSHALQAKGFHVLVFLAGNQQQNIDQVLEEILDYQVAGIVLASVSLSSDLAQRCEAAGVPVILFNRHQPDRSLPAVTSDNILGGRKLGNFLVAGGHYKIAHVAGWEGASTQIDREKGFREALDEAGLELYARAAGDFNFDKAKEAARFLFGPDRPKRDPPDSVFVANDHMAFAVMDTLRYELGVSIPQDVSVVGYDDVPLASWPSYDLTTARQPANRMVEATVEALLARLEGEVDTLTHVKIDGPLIVRGSARRPKEIDFKCQ